MILELRNIEMQFKSGDGFISILRKVNFAIGEGESVALVGPSGSGKSTFLQIAALLEKPTFGTVIIDGVDATSASDEERTKLRRENLGFVYQFHNLLPEFSALENVMMPQLIRGLAKHNTEERARELLVRVGLGHRLGHTPRMLSGGEQQRVAIARALANNPKMVIADEPTGNLDPKNSEMIFNLFRQLARENKAAMLMATHNTELAQRLDHIATLDRGEIA